MLSQISRVKRVIGAREIDALLVSVGGNDVGFTNMIITLIARNQKDKIFSLKSIQNLENLEHRKPQIPYNHKNTYSQTPKREAIATKQKNPALHVH